MVCLQLRDSITNANDVRTVYAKVSKCSKNAFFVYASVGAADDAARLYPISNGAFGTVTATLADTALYFVTDGAADRKFERFAVMDVLVDTVTPLYSARVRVLNSALTVTATYTATISLVNPPTATTLMAYPNLRSGGFSCDGHYLVASYITTAPTATTPSVTTVVVLDATATGTITPTVSFTFTGRTNQLAFPKVSCSRKRKAARYVVFASAYDTGTLFNSADGNILYVAPAYLNAYKIKTSDATAELKKQRKLPQYGLSIKATQPLARGVPSLIAVGTRLTVRTSTSPSILRDPTFNVVLSTKTRDTAELRSYEFDGKHLRCIAARKRGFDVEAVEWSHTSLDCPKWLFTTEGIITYEELQTDVFTRANASLDHLNLYAFPDQRKFLIQEVAPAPYYAIALDQGQNKKYLIVAGADGGVFIDEILLYQTNRKRCC